MYHSLFVTILCILIFTQCKNTEDEITLTNHFIPTLCPNDQPVTITISSQDEISIEFPECFTATPLQGFDSYVGIIEAIEYEIKINYDIGGFSYQYVKENGTNQVTVQGEFEEFRYKQDDDNSIFTFPEAGPANFYTSQMEYKDDLIHFFKTLKIN